MLLLSRRKDATDGGSGVEHGEAGSGRSKRTTSVFDATVRTCDGTKQFGNHENVNPPNERKRKKGLTSLNCLSIRIKKNEWKDKKDRKQRKDNGTMPKKNWDSRVHITRRECDR